MRLFEGTQWDRPPRCERCGEFEENLHLPASAQGADATREADGPPRRRETKKGKVVTVVRGLPAEENDLPGLLGHLKAACGAGGTIKDDELEIQGDHLERVRGLLTDIGYRVRGWDEVSRVDRGLRGSVGVGFQDDFILPRVKTLEWAW